MKKWLVMVDVDNTLARSSLGIHPGDRTAWARALACPIRAIPAAARTLPGVAKLADVALVSGRPEYVEPQTRRWMRRHFSGLTYRLHLCPVGTDPRDFKAEVFRTYRRRYAGQVCAIDDVRFDGPRHFFTAPHGWANLLAFLQQVAGESALPTADDSAAEAPAAEPAAEQVVS